MPQTWKLVLIGGEVTVLAAFTGLGLHLVMQPHRFVVAPPPLLIPAARPAAAPGSPMVAASRPSQAPAPTGRIALNPELFSKFGQQDRGLMNSQWDILRQLMGAMERYLEHKVIPGMEGRR
jgi:hypothetical protein